MPTCCEIDGAREQETRQTLVQPLPSNSPAPETNDDEPTAFEQAVRHLQKLYFHEVGALRAENRELRNELEEFRLLANHAMLSTWAVGPDDDGTVNQTWEGADAKAAARPGSNGAPGGAAVKQAIAPTPFRRADSTPKAGGRGAELEAPSSPKSPKPRPSELSSKRPSLVENADAELMRRLCSDEDEKREAIRCFSQARKDGKRGLRAVASRVVTSNAFDMIIGLVIVFNSVTIGVDTAMTARTGDPTPQWIQVCEGFFLAVYILELATRVAAHGRAAFRNPWVKFDSFLVGCGIAEVVVKVVLDYMYTSSSGNSWFLENLGRVMLVRTLRLARMVRVLRLMDKFRTLWLLVQGLLNSVTTLLWTFVLIAILLYLFTIVGLEWIQFEPVDVTWETIARHDASQAHFDASARLTYLMNPDDSNASAYMVIGRLDPSDPSLLFDFADGRPSGSPRHDEGGSQRDEPVYRFRLFYNSTGFEGSDVMLEWEQSSWLTESSVKDFQCISPQDCGPASRPVTSRFRGLCRSSDAATVLDGDGAIDGHWWNGVGVTTLAADGNETGIPGWDEAIYQTVVLQVARKDGSFELWEAYNAAIEGNFKDFPNTMLTLLQGLTLDSVGNIYRPIVLARWWLVFYFITFILIISIALMNLVTALMVESAISQATDDREMKRKELEKKKKKLVEQLVDIFHSLDTDHSGMLSLQELHDAPQHVLETLYEVTGTHERDDVVQIFSSLDYDASGNLAIGEFCEGLLNVFQGKPLELTCVRKQCTEVLVKMTEALEVVKKLERDRR